MNDTINAEVNHGRWIAFCPVCRDQGMVVALIVEPGVPFVCPEEFPETLATTMVPNPRVKGAFNTVPDEAARQEARELAISRGKAFEVLFPANKKEIEDVLRVRPVAARNWYSPKTADDLRRENVENGVSV